MKLDSEKQREFLLEMFNTINFPGKGLELAYQMKQAVLNAAIDRPAEESNQ